MTSATVVRAIGLLEEAERSTRKHIFDLMEETGLNDARASSRTINELRASLLARDKEIVDLRKSLADAKDEILCMENRNYGMVRFSNSLLKRLDQTPGGCAGLDQPDYPSTVAVLRKHTDSDSSEWESSIGMTQKLEERVADFERRELEEKRSKLPPSPCDTSSGSFQPVLKRRRKVSLEKPEKKCGGVLLCDGSQSTSEAEFE